MAKYRVVVLCLSSWIIAGFSSGALHLEITTNPVELWASPNSRSRLEKDFFENNFKPFYRTEQIFIKTVGISEVSIPVQAIHVIELLTFVNDVSMFI